MAVNPAASGGTPQITGAIRQAAQSTGISFDYLLTTAKIESNFNPSAQASTSSAKGLYQFIDQTWLGTMKQDGAALGLGRYAGAIARSADGHYDVSDPAMRAAILRLRSDPQVSAMLAGALTRNNAALVSSNIGRQPSSGELYIAHFLGADGAGKLINGAAKQPHARAAAMFPHAAAANHSIFYDASGRARSVGEVYGKLTRLFDSARTVAFAQSGVADVAGGFGFRACTSIASAGDRCSGTGESRTKRSSCAGCIGSAAEAASADSIAADAVCSYLATGHGRDDAGLCEREREDAATAAGTTVLPVDVHGPGQSAFGADREQSVGCSRQRYAGAAGTVLRPVHRRAAQRAQTLGRQSLIERLLNGSCPVSMLNSTSIPMVNALLSVHR
jgi:hypothetical protein